MEFKKPTTKMTLDKIIEILGEFKDFDPKTITRDTSFETLGLDSLDTVDFIMKVEEKLGVSIPMDKELIKTIGNVVDFIDGQQP